MLAQLVALRAWPRPYAWNLNYISDLGMRSCGKVLDGSGTARWVCSPGHETFNAGLIVAGVLLAAGAGAMAVRRRGEWGVWSFFVLSGLAMVVMAMIPADEHLPVHDLAALAQVMFQWAGMAALARPRTAAAVWPRMSPTLSAVTWSVLVLSVGSYVAFLLSHVWGDLFGLRLGTWERLATDSLSLWVLLAGACVLVDLAMPRARIRARSSVEKA
ncbi:hypothetical membrane protein [Austwickia chelonae]|uniref:DUF998 domain-containing protein n=1 Tax=Austwickia chelonae NBRC 105200 TaxID=1184607 RepID=K6V8L1_9MICO|nr:DUF998 domain-containing protein [Austwickia chelonae]GAB78538.1 hypothetical protein AUCHE_10_00050 [Austwickia chelonae NBRC 105200]SEW40565.1 hypothetical membrane protein [Austwickia chelonae]